MKGKQFAVFFIFLVFILLPLNVCAENCNLRTLIVTNGTMAPEFDPDTSMYNVVLKNQETKLKMNVAAENPDAVVTISGQDSIEAGRQNNVTITVSSGTDLKEYKLLVYRETGYSNPIDENCLLKSLQINNGKIPIAFSSGKYFYEIELNSYTDLIKVWVETMDPDDSVEILGSNEVVDDNPQILNILVTDSTGKGRSIYTLYFTKQPKKKDYTVIAGVVALITGAVGAFFVSHLVNSHKKSSDVVYERYL